MSESKPKIKVEHEQGYDGIHLWYSSVDKAVRVSLDTTKWSITVATEGQHYHIYKKE